MLIVCDLNTQLANLSDVTCKLFSVETSLQDGGDKILQLYDDFKVCIIRKAEMYQNKIKIHRLQ
jgi:hypothetical protein